MQDNDDMPDLDDFSQQLKSIQNNSSIGNSGSQDYTKLNTRYIENQQELAEKLNQQKQQQLKIEEKIQPNVKKQQYAGFKKGFLSANSNNKNQPKKQILTQIKAKTIKNPLELKQVQQAMKVNNYLSQTKSQWMTNDFLNTVTNNNKVNKLFNNPQYIKGIDLFKTNPKQAMQKYGHNKQFMQAFQQFCKLMGNQFHSLPKQ